MSTSTLPLTRRVLITNFVLEDGTGTEAYVRDVALRLVEVDRLPIIYTPRLGRFARRLIQDGIPVIDDLSQLSVTPDIIHGHHTLETAAAATRFPNVPVISFCHDAAAWHDTPLILPNVVHYVGVDQACYDRLLIQGNLSPDKVSLISNGVNLEKFPVRTSFAESPRSVLCFGNDFSEHHLQIVRSAAPGLKVKAIGLNSNKHNADPGSILPQFDIVLARGRCAREAIASGAATIAASVQGMASLVTPHNYDFLERNNFGRRILTKAFTVENIRQEIAKYDAVATKEVTSHHRHQYSLTNIVQQLTDLYDREKQRFSENPQPAVEASTAVSQLLAWASLHANVASHFASQAGLQSCKATDGAMAPISKPKRSMPVRIVRECKRVVRRTLRAVSDR